MAAEKIIISFDDEEENTLDVNLPEENKSRKEFIPDEFKPLFSGFKSDSQLTGFNTSEIIYPSGSERCFRTSVQSELKDEFINQIFQTYGNLILTSLNGNIYIIDKNNSGIIHKEHITGARFEKTGFAYNNYAYINSIDTVFTVEENKSVNEIYKTPAEYYIWNNLNCLTENNSVLIIINEYNPDNKNGYIKFINTAGEIIFSSQYTSVNIIPDKIPVSGNQILFFTDGFLHIIDFKNREVLKLEVNGLSDDNSDMLILNDKIYYYKSDNKIYYSEFTHHPIKEKYSGISIPGINSLHGYKKYLFAGSGNGWYVYESGGMQVHYYQDSNEFSILQLNENVLIAASGKNAYFSNLNIFQESERYLITPSPEYQSENFRLVSAIITSDKIFTLTSNGILTAFANDLLNVNV